MPGKFLGEIARNSAVEHSRTTAGRVEPQLDADFRGCTRKTKRFLLFPRLSALVRVPKEFE